MDSPIRDDAAVQQPAAHRRAYACVRAPNETTSIPERGYARPCNRSRPTLEKRTPRRGAPARQEERKTGSVLPSAYIGGHYLQ